MSTFFPKQTIEWRMEEPPAFRRLSLSMVEMAAITGVLLRLLRAVTFANGTASWLYYGALFAIGLALLLGMATAHLANFPVRRWVWRAPLFALIEAVAEMLMSLVLISIGREPEGTIRATFHDWPSMAERALLQSELAVCLWALLLAGIIALVRRSGVAGRIDEPEIPDVPLPPRGA